MTIVVACGGGGNGSQTTGAAAATGSCGGEQRPQLDCASEVHYDATSVSASLDIAKLGGVSGAVEQKAIRQIDEQTGLYIAESRRLCDEYNKCVLDKATYSTRSENLRRRIAKGPELIESMKSATNDDDRRVALSKAYRAVVPDEARTELGMEMSVLAQRPGESSMTPLGAGASLATGSRVAFVVQVTRPAYVYLFQKSSSGAVTVLFPDPRIPTQNPLAPQTSLRIPQGAASFKLDDNDIGSESVYVVASLNPVAELASAADQARAGGPPPAALTKVASIDAGCKTRALTFDDGASAAPQTCARSRGLSLDPGDSAGAAGAPTPAGATRASVSATTEAADNTIATVFRFNHTH
jgi:hypothetical protein